MCSLTVFKIINWRLVHLVRTKMLAGLCPIQKFSLSLQSLSHIQLLQPHGLQPLFMGFSRQECWSGLPFPSSLEVLLGIYFLDFSHILDETLPSTKPAMAGRSLFGYTSLSLSSFIFKNHFDYIGHIQIIQNYFLISNSTDKQP